uniref:DNA primase n=1 Tax=Gongylonema pulchrum TaxID=637853 RepID=A0A183EXD1_9BILA
LTPTCGEMTWNKVRRDGAPRWTAIFEIQRKTGIYGQMRPLGELAQEKVCLGRPVRGRAYAWADPCTGVLAAISTSAASAVVQW